MATHFSILARKAHGQRSLVGYSSRGLKESDTTKYLTLSYPLNSANVVIIHMNKSRLKVIPMIILTQNLKSCQGRGIPFHPQSYEHVKESAFNAETQVQSPGQGRSPGEGKGSFSSILAWRSAWIEEPGELQSMGLQRVRHDWMTNTHTQCDVIIQFCSCGGKCQTTVHTRWLTETQQCPEFAVHLSDPLTWSPLLFLAGSGLPISWSYEARTMQVLADGRKVRRVSVSSLLHDRISEEKKKSN